MAMDITQLQAVLTARDEASPIVQSFLNLIRQARDVTSGYGAATSAGLNSTTTAWQAQFDASQRAISKLSELPGVAAAAASAISGLGQTATTSSQQTVTAVDAVARSLGNVGPAAQQAAQQVQTAMNTATAAAQNAAQQVQRFGQGTLPTGSGFQATGQSASDIAAQRALADAQRQSIINSTQAVQTAIPNINQASEAWNRYSNAVSGTKGPTTEAVNITNQMRSTMKEGEAGVKALNDRMKESADATKQHSEAWVSLGGIMSHLPGPMGEVGAAFGTIHEKITQAQASMLALSAVATMVGVSILGGLGGAVDAAGKFESTFADVKTVLEGTGETIDAFQEKALQLGVQTQFNSQKVAQGFYELSSAGLNVRESLAAIEPAVMAATLGHRELNETTFALATTMRQFGLEAGDMTRIVDVMARMAADSTLHWSEMSQVFRNVQGSAKFMNISIEETGAALEVMANAATPATMAGTAFRTFLDRLSKGTGEAGAAMHALNLQMYDSNGAFVGLLPLMQQIENATKGMTDAEKDGVIAKLGGARANALIRDTLNAKKDVEIEGQTVTLRGTEVLGYFIQRNNEAAGAAQRMFDITKQTFEFQRDVFTASIQEAAIRIGNQLLPALTAILPAFTAVVNAFVQAPPAVHAAATAMALVGGTMLTIAGTAGTLAVVLPLLTAAFTGTATASAASAAAIGASAAAGSTAAVAATASATAMEAAGLATTASTAAMVTALGPLALIIGGLVVASGLLAVAWVNDWGNIRTNQENDSAAIQAKMTEVTGSVVTQGEQLAVAADRWGQFFSRIGTGAKAIADIPRRDGPVQAMPPGMDPEQQGALGNAAGNNFVQAYFDAFRDKFNENRQVAIQETAETVKRMREVALGEDEIAAGALDKVAFGAADKIKHGADIQEAALQELWARVTTTDENGIQHFGEVSRDELEQVVGRIRQILKMPGVEEEVANVLGNVEDAYSASMRRLMANADGDIGKALKEAIMEGSQRQAVELLNVEAGQSLVKSAIKDTNTEYQAQVRIMEQATAAESAYEAVNRTLQFLLANGNITTKQYQEFLSGVTIEHEKAAKAATTAAGAERDLLKAMTPGQRIWEQSAASAVGNITKGLTINNQAMLADLTEGLPKQEALKRIVEASGTKINLADLYYGSPQEVADREALIAAALQGGAISKLPPIVKEQGKAAGQAVATGVGEAAPAAQAAGEAVGTAVNTGLDSTITGRTHMIDEMRTKLEELAALATEASTTGEAIGEAVDTGVQRAFGADDAEETADAYIQGLEDPFVDGRNAIYTSAGVMATGVDTKVADVISPERAAEITTGFITSIGDTFANTPIPPERVESILQGLKNQFKTGLTEGTLTEEDAANWVKVATIALAHAATNSTEITAVGTAIDTGIASGATSGAESELAPVLATAIDTAAGAVSDAAQTAGREKVGTPLVVGIAQGIRLSPGPVQSAVQEIIDAAIEAAKEHAGIHSPSDVMASEVGLPLAQGIGVGFLGGIGSVKAQVQAGVADLVSGATAEFSRGMGQLVTEADAQIGMEIKKTDPTAPFSPLSLPRQGTAPPITSGFSEDMRNWTEKLLNTLELTSYDQSKSGNMVPVGIRSNAKYKGGGSFGINFGDYQDDGTDDGGPETWDPYNDRPATPQDELIAFSPGGRRNLARGASVDLSSLLGAPSSQAAIRSVAETLASEIVIQVSAATGAAMADAQAPPTGPYTPPFVPSQQIQTGLERHEDKAGNVTWTPVFRPTTAQEQAQQAADVANARLPDWANPYLSPGEDVIPIGGGPYQGPIRRGPQSVSAAGVSPYWGDYYRQLPSVTGQAGIEGWQEYIDQRLAQVARSGIQVPGVPAGMTYAQAVAANPYNQVDYSGLPANMRPQPLGTARRYPTAEPLFDEEQRQATLDAYTEQRRALRESGQTIGDFTTRVAQVDQGIADLGGAFNGYLADFGQTRMTEEEWRGSLAGQGVQVGSSSGTYPPYPDFPRPYVPGNPNASDAEIQQYQRAMYDQSLERESGIIPISAMFSGAVPYSQGYGPWIGLPQNNPYTQQSPSAGLTDQQYLALANAGAAIPRVGQSQFDQLNAGYAARIDAYQSAYYGAQATRANVQRDPWTPYFPGGEPNRYAPLNEAVAANAPYAQLDSTLRMASGNLDLFNLALGRTQGSVDTTTRTFGQLSEADQQRVIAQRAYFDENSQLVSGLRDANGNIKEFAGVVRNADGSIDQLATSTNLAAVQQGQYIDQFGQLQGVLTTVTDSLGGLGTQAGDLEQSFQSAGAIFAGEGGPGLSSGINSPLFNSSLANGALLPGNVNPGDYYIPDVATFQAQLANLSKIPAYLLSAVQVLQSISGGQAGPRIDMGGFAANAGQANNIVGGLAGLAPNGWFGGTVNAQNRTSAQFLDAARAAQEGANAAGLDYGGGVSGTGFASAPFTFGNAKEGFIPSGTRESASLAAAALSAAAKNAHDFSVALAGLNADTPIVALSWSSIRDWSKQAENSVSKIAGAFSAFPGIDLNTTGLSSITGSYTKPTLGGSSSPNPVAGGPFVQDNGSSYGGQALAREQLLVNLLESRGIDQSRSDFNSQLAKLRVATGLAVETTDDLRREQEEATNEVNNWTNVVNMGIPAAQQLADAQARLANVTNLMASTVTAPTSTGSTPWQGTPGGPPPKEPPPDAPPGHWVVGAYGQGWQWLPDSVSGGTLPTGTTGGTFSNNVPTPPTTTTTTTTPTGPVLIASTGTEDIYRMPDGTIKRYPKGTGPTASTGGGIDSAVFAAIPSPLPLPTTVAPQTGGDAGSPAGASIAVTVPVTVTPGAGQDGQQVGQKFAAVILKAVVEEGRRQGYDITKAGNK